MRTVHKLSPVQWRRSRKGRAAVPRVPVGRRSALASSRLEELALATPRIVSHARLVGRPGRPRQSPLARTKRRTSV